MISDSSGNVDPLWYHPNDNLASAIARAWADDSFRKRLLTFDETKDAANWQGLDYGKTLLRTSQALAEEDVFVATPVVLTHVQYIKHYKKQSDDEVVFVLPKRPDTLANHHYALEAARMNMRFIVFGM